MGCGEVATTAWIVFIYGWLSVFCDFVFILYYCYLMPHAPHFILSELWFIGLIRFSGLKCKHAVAYFAFAVPVRQGGIAWRGNIAHTIFAEKMRKWGVTMWHWLLDLLSFIIAYQFLVTLFTYFINTIWYPTHPKIQCGVRGRSAAFFVKMYRVRRPVCLVRHKRCYANSCASCGIGFDFWKNASGLETRLFV